MISIYIHDRKIHDRFSNLLRYDFIPNTRWNFTVSEIEQSSIFSYLSIWYVGKKSKLILPHKPPNSAQFLFLWFQKTNGFSMIMRGSVLQGLVKKYIRKKLRNLFSEFFYLATLGVFLYSQSSSICFRMYTTTLLYFCGFQNSSVLHSISINNTLSK